MLVLPAFCIITILSALLFFGCSPDDDKSVKPGTVMIRVDPDKWPDLVDDLDGDSLRAALEQSRTYLKKLPEDRLFKYGPDQYTAVKLLASLDAFEKYFNNMGPGPELTKALAKDFILYQSVGSDGAGKVVCTGYYEPQLPGALSPDNEYKWPLYSRPDDLIDVDLEKFSAKFKGKRIRGRLKGTRLIPYYSRNDIDRDRVLEGRGLEFAWVNDPASLFFLHIQGSGRIILPDGNVVRVGYAAGNGRTYRSIGKKMFQDGLLSRNELSMQGIRSWLRNNPEKAAAVMDHNESYVFFRKIDTAPVGNINVPLTPNRSAALDHKIFPRGALAWLQSRKPVVEGDKIKEWMKFSRFVMVQDTGGAITGPGRLDLFFGHGLEAETAAGHFKEEGALFFLVMK